MESNISSLYGPLSTLVIACAGAGVLAFPFAMYRAGLVLGVAVTIALGAINLYSMRIITRMSVPVTRESPHFAACLQRAQDINAKTSEDCTLDPGTDMIRTISYIDLMYILLGPRFGVAAKAAVFVGTLGGLVAFLIIISDLAAPVLSEYFPDSFFTGRPFVIIAFVIFVVFPLSVVPDLESLTLSSIIAVVTIVIVGIVVVVQSFSHDFIDNLSVAHAGPSHEYSVFQAVPLILFAFAGILQVVSVMGEMSWDESGKTVRDMNLACNWTVLICAFIYIVVGVFGFIEFGDDTEGVILDDYDSDDILANLGRLSMAIHVALAYPVILFPAQQSLLHSFIMPIYTRIAGKRSLRSVTDPALFQGSRVVKVEAAPAVDEGSTIRSALHSPPQDHTERQSSHRTLSVEVIDAEEIPLALRIASAVTITFLTAVIAILLPQAEIVFGFMGSLVGSTLVLILPAVLALEYECGPGTDPFHRYAAQGMLGLGIAVAIFGFSLNVIAVSNS